MLGRRALAVGVVVLATAAVLLCTGAEAGASWTDWAPARPSAGEICPPRVDDQTTHMHQRLGGRHLEPTPPGTAASGAPGGGYGGAFGTESTPTVTVSGGPTVGGAPATTTGAAVTEALVAPTAPTPPNGAEPAAAGSPGAAVPTDGVVAEVAASSPAVVAEVAASSPPVDAEVAAAPPPAAAPALPDLLGSAIAATGPLPAANGLSPDATESGGLVAVVAFVVLLFLVAHQLVDRRDPRLRAARDADAVARFP